MQTTASSLPYQGFRYPQAIISHAVWLYFRFCLSYRDVEELLAERGIIVTYERSANGRASSANVMRTTSDADGHGQAISGFWMKCS